MSTGNVLHHSVLTAARRDRISPEVRCHRGCHRGVFPPLKKSNRGKSSERRFGDLGNKGILDMKALGLWLFSGLQAVDSALFAAPDLSNPASITHPFGPIFYGVSP
jgi:hypothetical protein